MRIGERIIKIKLPPSLVSSLTALSKDQNQSLMSPKPYDPLNTTVEADKKGIATPPPMKLRQLHQVVEPDGIVHII